MTYDYKNINKYITEGRFEELIEISEKRMQLQFETLLKLIRVKDNVNYHLNDTVNDNVKDSVNDNLKDYLNYHSNDNSNDNSEDNSKEGSLTDLLMVSGPSSSGKTTTASLLAEFLEEDGYNCTVISLDDYYFDLEINHRIQIEKGIVPEGSTDFDYETIEAIDVEFFRQQMLDYTSGHSIALPKYDFTIGKRVESGRIIESTPKDMIIIEGIHAFNPRLTSGLPFDTSLKIYVCPFDSYVSEYKGVPYTVEPHQIRFMRRAIRDGVHRAAPLSRTIEMWPGVRRGEKNYMEPLLPYTDIFINTSHEYEIAYLKKRIIDMAEKSSPDTRSALSEIIRPEALMPFIEADGFEIPSKSVFREFYV